MLSSSSADEEEEEEKEESMMGSRGPRRQPSKGGRGAAASTEVDVVVGESVSGSGKEAETNERLLICRGGVVGGAGVLSPI